MQYDQESPEDRFWKDYATGSEHTFGGSIREMHQGRAWWQQDDAFGSSTGASGGRVSRGGSGEGFLSGLMEWYGNLWPIRVTMEFGRDLTETAGNWKLNAPLACLGLLFAAGTFLGPDPAWSAGSAFLASVTGPYVEVVALCLGAAAGWFTVPTIGFGIVLVGAFTAMGLALGTMALVCWGGWLVLKAWLESQS